MVQGDERMSGKLGRKVIITCAVTGAIHTPTMSPYLPITPDEIAEAAIGAAEAGAAIVHLHARMPEDGRPSQDPDLFRQFLPKIKAASRIAAMFDSFDEAMGYAQAHHDPDAAAAAGFLRGVSLDAHPKPRGPPAKVSAKVTLPKPPPPAIPMTSPKPKPPPVQKTYGPSLPAIASGWHSCSREGREATIFGEASGC
jgi:hypothetical protein